MNTAQNTREKIVELGRDYMQQIGYHSFNYKQIALELNIKNASIHHYYPSKEDLGLAVIEKDRQDFLQMTQQLKKAAPGDKLNALLGAYEQYFSAGKKLCVISTFTSSYNEITERMQLATSQYAEMIASWLAAVFKEGRETGVFHFEGPVDTLVNHWMATLPGALLVGRSRGQKYFELAMTSLKNSLKSS
jgi:TetR/AcrR family transcriptional regulator, transcriptional repressor for nem operon